MRESFPLWTAWFGILFFWLYYLLTDTQTIECYDVAFRENKWTCWGFYSLHYLGHDEYFTKLSRISLMLFNFSWQGLILAGIYSTLGPGSVGTLGASADNGIIIWSAAIALAVSIPIPYLLGGTFLNYIKETTL